MGLCASAKTNSASDPLDGYARNNTNEDTQSCGFANYYEPTVYNKPPTFPLPCPWSSSAFSSEAGFALEYLTN